MKVNEEIKTRYGGMIQWGHSTWATDEDYVRLAWFDKTTGKFDPHSSVELPLWALAEMVIESAERDVIPKTYLGSMIFSLINSLRRFSFHISCNNIIRNLGRRLGYGKVAVINAGCLTGTIFSNQNLLCCKVNICS